MCRTTEITGTLLPWSAFSSDVGSASVALRRLAVLVFRSSSLGWVFIVHLCLTLDVGAKPGAIRPCPFLVSVRLLSSLPLARRGSALGARWAEVSLCTGRESAVPNGAGPSVAD